MPIANCIITPDCNPGSGLLIDLWAKESGISAEHMTINIIASTEQLGKRYSVMVNLLLPSIWSSTDGSSLQMGLARALSQHYSLAIHDILITTSLVSSGRVVESGGEVTW